MKLFLRGAGALSLVLSPFALVAPSIAQEAQTAAAEAPVDIPVPEPKALQTGDETPWLYRGSDVPVDREWLFGEMENGLRYAVRRNGVPPLPARRLPDHTCSGLRAPKQS